MRYPPTSDEYRHLALDICTIFFFAINFYFVLMLSVAHHAGNMTKELEEYHAASQDGEASTEMAMGGSRSLAADVAVSVVSDVNSYATTKRHLIAYMESEMVGAPEDSDIKEISRSLNNDFE